MKMVLLISLPLLAIATPVWGQANIDTGCEEDKFSYSPDQEIVPKCNLIIVTGNLNTSMSERDTSIRIIPRIIPGKTESLATSQRLEQALLSVPGLQQFRRSDARSANPTSQGVTLRGLGGNASSRAALFLDDVPQADPFGGWIAWPGYDAVNLASVRVLKGGGRPSAGPGAIAGVIELDSLQNQEQANLGLAYGSRNSVEGRARFIDSLGLGSISASASYARGDGFAPIRANQRGRADRAAPYEQTGVAIRAVAPISGDTELQTNMRVFTDKRDRGFDFSDSQNSGVDASLRLVNRGGGWNWSALGYVQIREFANRFGAVAADRNSVALTLDQYSVPSTGLGARFEVRPPVGDEAQLRIGGDWRRTIGTTKENFFFTGIVPGRNRVAGGLSDILGGFAELTLQPSDALTLTASGRADYWSIAGGFRKEINIGGSVRSDDKFTNRSGWEGTGRVGVAFQPDDAIKLRAAAYLGWRLPTLNELYRPFRVGTDATAANELLAPERVKGAEIGFEYNRDRAQFSVTAFANRLNDAIANVSQGRGPGTFPGVGFVAAGGTYRQRQNLDAIDSKGVEVDASWRSEKLTLKAGYAYVDAKIVSSGLASQLNGLRPAQVPQHFANAGFSYDYKAFKIDAGLRYSASQFEDDVNIRRLKSTFTADAGLEYAISNRFSVSVRGENILDAEVQAAISDTGIIERATPRTIWIGLSAKFD
jgi:vitamin B12 transporter